MSYSLIVSGVVRQLYDAMTTHTRTVSQACVLSDKSVLCTRAVDGEWVSTNLERPKQPSQHIVS